ncbi:cytochrome P450 [Actinomadura craniellae]|uniref:cytochrome P450 n=1 Tax=Actinomadura craniellae TaxID=2231787 RepID=UPI001F44D1F3|nr:cytochrome P450 [Actinomadura craniellae]
MKATVDVPSILGFDPADPGFLADPYAHYRRLDAAEALRRTPGGLWVTTSYELCGHVLRDARFGHHPEGIAQVPRRRSFLTLDPPDHTRLRRLVGKAFTARMVERLRPRVEAVVDELLADVRGEVDLLETLAYRYR